MSYLSLSFHVLISRCSHGRSWRQGLGGFGECIAQCLPLLFCFVFGGAGLGVDWVVSEGELSGRTCCSSAFFREGVREGVRALLKMRNPDLLLASSNLLREGVWERGWAFWKMSCLIMLLFCSLGGAVWVFSQGVLSEAIVGFFLGGGDSQHCRSHILRTCLPTPNLYSPTRPQGLDEYMST